MKFIKFKNKYIFFLLILMIVLKSNVVSKISQLTDRVSETTSEMTYQEKDIASLSDMDYLNHKNIPVSDEPFITVHDNIPYFTNKEKYDTTATFETYSELDELGRCGTAYAAISKNIMPTEERGEIGNIKPTGWHTVKYHGIDGNYLYNRCHLIAFSLAGENANEKNLITGTRYMNTKGMLPFEMEVLNYVRNTGNKVLYRVTPIYEGDNLLCEGVLMEGYSLEDNGAGIQFCVFCYNIQPGIEINYTNGDSSGPAYGITLGD